MTTACRGILLALLLLVPAASPLIAQQSATLGDDIRVKKLAKGIWLHTSITDYGTGPVPSNGLLVMTKKGIVLIDTPGEEEQTGRLVDWAEKALGSRVVRGIVTHAHRDRVGGVHTLKGRGIETCSTPLTRSLVDTSRFGLPSPCLGPDTTMTIGGMRFTIFHPGAGHTEDNIVVWLPDARILFGGCMIKAGGVTDLGNIADADLEQWPKSVEKVIARYPKARVVIPGHGPVGGKEILRHTHTLLVEHGRK